MYFPTPLSHKPLRLAKQQLKTNQNLTILERNQPLMKNQLKFLGNLNVWNAKDSRTSVGKFGLDVGFGLYWNGLGIGLGSEISFPAAEFILSGFVIESGANKRFSERE